MDFSTTYVVSFKRTPSFLNKIMRVNHSGQRTHQPIEPPKGKFYIANFINHSQRVTSIISKWTSFIMPILLEQFTLLKVQNIRNCTLDKTIQSLNERLNDHRSNVAHHLDRSDLVQSIIIKTTVTLEHAKDLWIFKRFFLL